jgi:hypothetical protein
MNTPLDPGQSFEPPALLPATEQGKLGPVQLFWIMGIIGKVQQWQDVQKASL